MPEPSRDAREEARVLNQLLASQSMLQVFSQPEKMCQWTEEVLGEVPGLFACSTLLAGADPPPMVLGAYTCRTYHLQTPTASFGHINLSIEDTTRFEPYSAATSNFINMVTID